MSYIVAPPSPRITINKLSLTRRRANVINHHIRHRAQSLIQALHRLHICHIRAYGIDIRGRTRFSDRSLSRFERGDGAAGYNYPGGAGEREVAGYGLEVRMAVSGIGEGCGERMRRWGGLTFPIPLLPPVTRIDLFFAALLRALVGSMKG